MDCVERFLVALPAPNVLGLYNIAHGKDGPVLAPEAVLYQIADTRGDVLAPQDSRPLLAAQAKSSTLN